MLISEECSNAKKTSVVCIKVSYLPILHFSKAELHCKLSELLCSVTAPKLFDGKNSALEMPTTCSLSLFCPRKSICFQISRRKNIAVKILA